MREAEMRDGFMGAGEVCIFMNLTVLMDVSH